MVTVSRMLQNNSGTEKSMNILVAMIATVVIVGVADAQMTNAPPNEPGGAQATTSRKSGEEASEERNVNDHIKQLHNELHITAAEEPQWSGVAETMRENARAIDRAIDRRDSTINTATAVDNLESYADVVQTHAAAVKRLADIFAPLYSEMSESQKKMADEIFSHRHHARNVAKS
jgi:hypothetical protein